MRLSKRSGETRRSQAPGVRTRGQTFAGSDTKRGAAKFRCPTGDYTPASTWVKAGRLHTLIPRSTDRWKTPVKKRTTVERGFGRSKTWALLPIRVRSLEKVRLHTDLTFLVILATRLATERLTTPTA